MPSFWKQRMKKFLKKKSGAGEQDLEAPPVKEGVKTEETPLLKGYDEKVSAAAGDNNSNVAAVNEKPKPSKKVSLRNLVIKHEIGVKAKKNQDKFFQFMVESLPSLMEKVRKDSPFIKVSHKSEKKRKKHIQYDPKSHYSVMFQMYGSVWPTVLPYCCLNVLITYGVSYAFRHGIDFTMPSSGHSFMSILVAFLVVSRAQITYARFMEARAHLGNCLLSCRELVQLATVLTQNSTSYMARQWRQDIAFRTIDLLRTTLVTVEFKSLPEEVIQEQLNAIYGPELEEDMKRLSHVDRTAQTDSFRIPILVAHTLRTEIMKTRKDVSITTESGSKLAKKWLDVPLHVNEEMKLLNYVTSFSKAFNGLEKLITTPFPFPLVQMARTFLFFWVFTLPLALVNDTRETFEVMIIVFFITYGFIGLEYVSIELDDPFGDDPNDFDDYAMAQMVFEDIYVAIYKVDGIQAAELLYNMIKDRAENTVVNNLSFDLVDEKNYNTVDLNENEFGVLPLDNSKED